MRPLLFFCVKINAGSSTFAPQDTQRSVRDEVTTTGTYCSYITLLDCLAAGVALLLPLLLGALLVFLALFLELDNTQINSVTTALLCARDTAECVVLQGKQTMTTSGTTY